MPVYQSHNNQTHCCSTPPAQSNGCCSSLFQQQGSSCFPTRNSLGSSCQPLVGPEAQTLTFGLVGYSSDPGPLAKALPGLDAVTVEICGLRGRMFCASFCCRSKAAGESEGTAAATAVLYHRASGNGLWKGGSSLREIDACLPCSAAPTSAWSTPARARACHAGRGTTAPCCRLPAPWPLVEDLPPH